jgi:hypothetical protein
VGLESFCYVTPQASRGMLPSFPKRAFLRSDIFPRHTRRLRSSAKLPSADFASICRHKSFAHARMSWGSHPRKTLFVDYPWWIDAFILLSVAWRIAYANVLSHLCMLCFSLNLCQVPARLAKAGFLFLFFLFENWCEIDEDGVV